MKKKFSEDFIDFSYRGKSVFHVVENIESIFKSKGYLQLELKDKWKIERGGKYYFKRNGSTIVIFSVGEEGDFFKVTANHTDTPGFKIKPMPVSISEKSYMRFNTEVYGGPILNTWLDRPLSIAGRVVVRGENALEPECINVDVDRPLLTIPNLAIHQNRDINNGVKLSKQNEMLPLATLLEEAFTKDDFFINFIAEECGVEKEGILDFDLFLYEYNRGSVIGVEDEFISCGKIDNLASTYAGLMSMLESDKHTGINILACFDNEEIGSTTKQGAESKILLNAMERIVGSLEGTENREDFLRSLYRSFMISVDGAHAVHPARGEKTDITNRLMINKGPAIKSSAAHSYTTDAFSGAVVKRIFQDNNLPYQYFVNHSDERGGMSLGPILSTQMDISSADIGLPMLAMHSVRELCGVEDLYALKELLKEFYKL